MALSIKTAEADALARELASLTNESITEAVTRALRERLHRVSAQRMDLAFSIEQLTVEFESSLVDARTADDIMGYDENGLPQ